MGDFDVALPRALMDFIFDLYDSVTLSQLTEEQTKLYEADFKELSQKYFANQPWPSPQSIAAECNGDPLFLAVYREMTHRHWHQVSRPTLRDRMDGWQVYRELFDEVLEMVGEANFYMLPQWVFDIMHEFSYQFQGYCQVKSAVYASARKHGLLESSTGSAEGGVAPVATTTQQQPSANLVDNLHLLQSNPDAWDIQLVFDYLHRFVQLGFGPEAQKLPVVYSCLGIFAAVTQSRIECILGDFGGSLEALAPLTLHGNDVITKVDEAGELKMTVTEIVNDVFGAKLSLAYHTGVSLIMVRRHKDAICILGDISATLSRGFKTGQLRKSPGSDQFHKQYERMLSLLALLTHICPGTSNNLLEDVVVRAIREKHGPKLEAGATSAGNNPRFLEEWFQSPKFVSTEPQVTTTSTWHRHLVMLFNKEMERTAANRNMRSYLKLYSTVSVAKLAKFNDLDSPEKILPWLWSYKVRSRQLESLEDGTNESTPTGEKEGNSSGTASLAYKDSLDIHYYMVRDMVYVDEAEKQRRFENFFFSRIEQNHDILRTVLAIDTKV